MSWVLLSNLSGTVSTVNLSFRMMAVFIGILMLVNVVRMKEHSERMGWFFVALCMVLGGLAAEFMAENSAAENMLRGGIGFVQADIFYSLTAPCFSLYFINTEWEEGQAWDKKFWSVLNLMIAVLLIMLSIYNKNHDLVWALFLLQYMLVIVMLLASPKEIRAVLWFVAGTLFPIISSFLAIALPGIRLTGFGLGMMFLMILFGYQLDVERELMQKRTELSESRASLLMEQIHPHFIYNSLQQIALLCGEDAGLAQEAVYRFSKYLRSNFESLTDEGMIPFEKEMEHVDIFLQIAGISISRNFRVEKDFQVTDFLIPALSLQPLVENAVQYGIGMSKEGDRILIKTEEADGWVAVRVLDDGHGKQARLGTHEKHKSIGTRNVRARLKLLCGGSLEIIKKEQGTEAVIRLPLVKAGTGSLTG